MNTGDLQVWWIPQIPMKAFTVDVATVQEGVKILDTLADYDIFQAENNVRADFCNAGGLSRWCNDNGDGVPGWEDWCDEETGEDDPSAWLEAQTKVGIDGG